MITSKIQDKSLLVTFKHTTRDGQEIVDFFNDRLQKFIIDHPKKKIYFSVGTFGEYGPKYDFLSFSYGLSLLGTFKDLPPIERYLAQFDNYQRFKIYQSLDLYRAASVISHNNIEYAEPDYRVLSLIKHLDSQEVLTTLVDDKNLFHYVSRLNTAYNEPLYEKFITSFMHLEQASQLFAQKNAMGYSPADLALFSENLTFIKKAFELLDTKIVFDGNDIERYQFRDADKKAIYQSFLEQRALRHSVPVGVQKKGFKL